MSMKNQSQIDINATYHYQYQVTVQTQYQSLVSYKVHQTNSLSFQHVDIVEKN